MRPDFPVSLSHPQKESVYDSTPHSYPAQERTTEQPPAHREAVLRRRQIIACLSLAHRVHPIEEESRPTASILISVPKKRFKRAVKRNRVKRQIREAYRKHKDMLLDTLNASGKKAIIAFIWLDNNLHSSQEVEEKVKHLLQLTSERLV